MIRTLLFTVALAALVAPVFAQDPAPSPWFSEAHWSALKTVDDLTTIGAGLAVNVYRFAPERSIWLDGCPLYDGGNKILGGFAGLSTEIKGLPVLEFILAPVASVADCVGLGLKVTKGEFAGAVYVSTHF
jgi:hypothetical protein